MAFGLKFGFILSYFHLLWQKGSKKRALFLSLEVENRGQIPFSLK